MQTHKGGSVEEARDGDQEEDGSAEEARATVRRRRRRGRRPGVWRGTAGRAPPARRRVHPVPPDAGQSDAGYGPCTE